MMQTRHLAGVTALLCVLLSCTTATGADQKGTYTDWTYTVNVEHVFQGRKDDIWSCKSLLLYGDGRDSRVLYDVMITSYVSGVNFAQPSTCNVAPFKGQEALGQLRAIVKDMCEAAPAARIPQIMAALVTSRLEGGLTESSCRGSTTPGKK